MFFLQIYKFHSFLDESEWTHQCDECDKRFSKKIYLKTHKSKEHLREFATFLAVKIY